MTDEAIFVGGDDTVLLKKAIARILYSKGIDQLKISEILNLSQPMVSNYCGSNDKIPENIIHLAEQISDKIINGCPTTFHTCVSFSDKPLEGRFFIANKTELINNENKIVVDNLTEAFLLLKGKNISDLVPEIKINIAMGKENPEKPDDIASFVNGLIIADDKITGHNGIRFGKSKHLSSLLVYLKDKIQVNSIMNVAFISNIENTSFSHVYLTKDFKLNENKKKIDVLLHKGDFGIEPCTYVLGKDAVEVSNKILKIKEEIKR